MDDPKFTPHFLTRLFPFARPAVAGVPTRTRPGRHIPFEPIPRLTPSTPPPWITQGPEEPSSATRLAQLGVRLLLGLGWLVFAAWWVIVLRRESTAALGRALGILMVLLVACAVMMALWTRYNMWVARRGQRGRSSMHIPMEWTHDTLGRPMDLAPNVQSAAEVQVVLRDGVKSYLVADEEQL